MLGKVPKMLGKNPEPFLKSRIDIPPYSEIFLDKYGKKYRFTKKINLITTFFE